jgi:transcriptional regulator with XRE-family HTH domain
MQAPISIQSAFGNFLCELRQKCGLHIEQLAEKSGVSSDRLNAIERGEVNLNLGTMLVLAMSMDTTPQELFRGIAGRIAKGPESRGGRIIPFPVSTKKVANDREIIERFASPTICEHP